MEQQITEILEETFEYIDRLINGINTVMNGYRSGNEGKAHELMVHVIDGFSWVLEVINATKLSKNIDITINEFLEEMIIAYKNLDYVLLCDLLEYEIIPVLENIRKIINDKYNLK